MLSKSELELHICGRIEMLHPKTGKYCISKLNSTSYQNHISAEHTQLRRTQL